MKWAKPPLHPVALTPQQLQDLTDGALIEGAHITSAVMTGQSGRRINFDSCILEHSEISSCQLKKADLIDVEFNDCLIFGTNFDGSSWQRVVIKSGMQSGIVLSDATIKDAVFDHAKLNLANFRSAILTRVEFKGCDLTEADFSGATLHSVTFSDCNLTGTWFSGCSLNDVDLRSSTLVNLHGVGGLKGAKIDTAQLISLAQTMAAELGLTVV